MDLETQPSFICCLQKYDPEAILWKLFEKIAEGLDGVSVFHSDKSTSVFVEASTSSDCRAIEDIFLTRLKEHTTMDPVA